MQTSQVVALLHARKYGKGWRARCPIHQSRVDTLSIHSGHSAVLIKCFAGCELKDLLSHLGLKTSDLFYNQERPSLDHLRRLRELEAQQEHERREKRRIANLAIERAYVWDTVAHELGRTLANYPDDTRLAVLFHRALFLCRRCESIAEAYYTPKTWGIGIVAGCGYKWPVKVTREQVGDEYAMRLGL